MKIAFFSARAYERAYFDRANWEGLHHLWYTEVPLREETAALANGHEAVCIFVNDRVTAMVAKQLAAMGVRLIALRCAGFNQVDLAATEAWGLTVVRVPAYSPHAVAEHTVALILALNRKIHRAYNRVREGNFALDNLMGFDLCGKTIGVVGTGKIGKAFAQIMMGFGCRVLGFDPYPNPELEAKGMQYTTMDTLLEQSDIVSLHCPLTEATYHLINADKIRLMRRGAMLINTGRGALIDTQAVIQALKDGHLGYLGLDVYEQEEGLFFRDLSYEIIQDDLITRLMTFPNVLITSHQAFFTHEAMTEIAHTTLHNITAFERGLPLENAVRKTG
ncbi:MAG: 2-hydroxyacid dehydrogenase [Saprospiraceae bacterium]|nr:2-hydroxyacid dehydrogenase [Saprospiraceae bacterium]MDW8483620.1 2-hydroxyacid dehydrogenase [Saprospiraceae bacterium]